jgi:hypothetical protein
MRLVDQSSPIKQLVTKTDPSGNYRLEMTGITKATSVSIDAMKPGYQRLVGTLMSGGDARCVEVRPGAEVKSDLALFPALYFAGTVVDEHGRAIAGVRITADETTKNSTAGVEITASNADGSFELFNYSLQPSTEDNEVCKGLVTYFHPDYVPLEIKDVYAIAPQLRATQRIVLNTGHQVAGKVLDVAGHPVPHVMVRATDPEGTGRKATITDPEGRFELRGLPDGPTMLMIRVVEIKQKARVPLVLASDQNDLKIRLQAMRLPKDLKKYNVLDMQLTNVTPELKSTYDLWDRRGVLILDPGKNSDRLGIGQLAEGYDFWIVGDQQVGSVREFVRRILSIAAGEKTADPRIRVVYSFSTIDFDGTFTAHLKVTQDDLAQLQAVLDQSTAEDQEVVLALGKLGAQFRLKPAKPAGKPEDMRAGSEVSLIILGNKWHGVDGDLHLVSTLPFDGLYVRGRGKVSDQALEELRVARPDINVDRVSEAFLGAEFLPDTHPPQVAAVLPNSPAARASFKAKDVLIEFAGKPVPDFAVLRRLTFTLKPGQKVAAILLRKGKIFSVTVEMSAWD